MSDNLSLERIRVRLYENGDWEGEGKLIVVSRSYSWKDFLQGVQKKLGKKFTKVYLSPDGESVEDVSELFHEDKVFVAEEGENFISRGLYEAEKSKLRRKNEEKNKMINEDGQQLPVLNGRPLKMKKRKAKYGESGHLRSHSHPELVSRYPIYESPTESSESGFMSSFYRGSRFRQERIGGV